MATFGFDVNQLPFGMGGVLGASQEYQNALARNQQSLRQQQLQNQQSEKMNPLAVRQQELQNQFAEQNNPLAIEMNRTKLQHEQNPLYALMGTGNPAQTAAAQQVIMQSPQYRNSTQEQQNALLQPFQQYGQAQQRKEEAMANYYGLGGGRAPAAVRLDMALENSMVRDNPQLSGNPQAIFDAVNALKNGQTTLPDGTPLNFSQTTLDHLARVAKTTSDATQRNQMSTASQAEAEMRVFDKYTNQATAKFGDTYLNKSPREIAAEFSNDPKKQKELGELIAANQLQFDKAALMNRIQGLQPGITSVNEIMEISQQHIDLLGLRISAEARQEAARIVAQAMKEALNARKSVGIRAGDAVYGSRPTQGAQQGNNATPQENDPLGLR